MGIARLRRGGWCGPGGYFKTAVRQGQPRGRPWVAFRKISAPTPTVPERRVVLCSHETTDGEWRREAGVDEALQYIGRSPQILRVAFRHLVLGEASFPWDF